MSLGYLSWLLGVARSMSLLSKLILSLIDDLSQHSRVLT